MFHNKITNQHIYPVPNYRRWIRDIEELQTVKIGFALLADADCAVLKSVSELQKLLSM
jgi:hypothetical protein